MLDKQTTSICVALTGVFFLAGLVAGCLVAGRIQPEALVTLSDYLESSLTRMTQGGTGVMGHALFTAFLMPTLVFILGYTIPGVAGIPLVMAARGFLLSYAINLFYRVFGSSGLIIALGALIPQSLLSLPCLFLLASQGMMCSLSLLSSFRGKGRRLPPNGRTVWRRVLICAAVLTASALLEAFVSPRLLSAILPLTTG